jgi:hypothetical protein
MGLQRHVSTHMSHRQAKLEPVNVFDNYAYFWDPKMLTMFIKLYQSSNK